MPRRKRARQHDGSSGGVSTALKEDSWLQARVRPGIQALEAPDVDHIEETLRPDFHDSLPLDDAFRERSPSANRWDYILGRRRARQIVGFEVHPATPGEVGRVISKKQWASEELKSHLRASSGGWA
jgi:hypothetical protein